MYQMPPMLRGSAEEDIRRLRDYLVLLAGELESAESAPVSQTVSVSRTQSGASGSAAPALDSAEEKRLRETASALKSLIIKTAGELTESFESTTSTIIENGATKAEIKSLKSLYVTKSDFGSYAEAVESQIVQTAKSTVESYELNSLVQTVDDRVSSLASILTNLRGEIRRGIITDPQTGEECMGIAISEKLSFTGEERTEDGVVYYTLSPGQTLGLYTSTGWQFWINGVRRGYFSSEDSSLHLSAITVTDSIRMGDGWILSFSGGLGLRRVQNQSNT